MIYYMVNGMDYPAEAIPLPAGVIFGYIFAIFWHALMIPSMCPWIPRSQRKWLGVATVVCNILALSLHGVWGQAIVIVLFVSNVLAVGLLFIGKSCI